MHSVLVCFMIATSIRGTEFAGFVDYSSHVAKIGRTQFVEIHVLVTPQSRIDTATADGIRREIATRLNASWPEFWLTVDFTADRAWL